MADGRFLQPWTAGRRKDYSDNVNYAVGVQIITQWTADFSNAAIDLVQDNHPGLQIYLSTKKRSYNQKTWNWKVTYAGLDPTFNNVFYLSVTSADGSDSFTSHYFNISNAESTSPATAAATSSASPSTSPTQASLTTVTVAPSNTNAGTPAGTIAGVVVASVLGTLLLAGAAWWAWKIKKRRNNENTPRAQQSIPPNIEPPFNTEPKPHEVDRNQIQELYNTEPKPHELDRNQVHELYETERERMFELQETERRRMFELEGPGREVRT
ncbi:MAG: hypothetical protein L6R38_005976 [Xanthoria sp. 2 TBL-2021]|nr:MAG: hypothetical protein L6R38_005976 [Xanthoria sp. 2 TBL-2021]